ncbi:pyridoxamine 5'-phosphate oxidase family protein [Agrococcus sp. SGAir0287]|uniref:pyridoxamine 5'-phosphate oxidase family protein n=1 Tax=Agrococcus sp. SGAir0287 TaxID=2070347 RepID=UPI0010CCC8E5|nr:TIGR03618 family F420-dependent PPOX class oxidoreductase [Agrococcus sp. SGAir0287]QCR20426.1 acyltransferase [Agrococcus sp. SGAir0287]
MASAPDSQPGSDAFVRFWSDYRLCMLASPRPDGSIHQVPVGATYDADANLVRIIASKSSFKARNVARRPGLRASVSQVEGRWWSTIEGWATVSSDPERVAEAVRRYAERYRQPRESSERIVIEIAIERAMGSVPPLD